MSEKKLVRFSLAALLAALAVPSASSAAQAAAATKAGVQSDASAATAVTGVPGPGGTEHARSDGVAKAPARAVAAGPVGGRPGPVLSGRLVVLDAEAGTFGIEGKNGLFRSPKGTDLASIGGKRVRVHAKATGEVSSIEVVGGEAASSGTNPAEPVQN
ncbi:MAG TPA: hypothetical protein VEC57_16665 [Candidatus Limnocylindrales bacterium]|nr:hypothetical protein [Candidatus Limnocylindrales bacterium]